MRITCNGKTVECGANGTIDVLPYATVSAFFGGNDLYDLGFTHDDLNNHNLIVEENGCKVVFICKKQNEERLERQFMHEFRVSEATAKFMLRKHDYNYGMARIYLQHQKNSPPNPKPCGEIPLGTTEVCNISTVFPDEEALKKIMDQKATMNALFPWTRTTPEDVTEKFEGVLTEDIKEKLAKNVESFEQAYPQTAQYQEMDRIRGKGEPIQRAESKVKIGGTLSVDVVRPTSKMLEVFAQVYGPQDPRVPHGYYRIMKGWTIREGDQYLSSSGSFQSVGSLAGMKVGSGDVLVIRKMNPNMEIENPCADVPDRGLNMECVCGEIGKAHCRLHSPAIVKGGEG